MYSPKEDPMVPCVDAGLSFTVGDILQVSVILTVFVSVDQGSDGERDVLVMSVLIGHQQGRSQLLASTPCRTARHPRGINPLAGIARVQDYVPDYRTSSTRKL